MTAVVTENPVLKGVHHTARPTWKLRETVEFYRDKLGLPLVHAISARGWGPANHPDFLHFFFKSGKGSTIAFFYYIGADQPDYTKPLDEYRSRANHTAWAVDGLEELLAWRARLEAQGIPLRYQLRHELIESIYFNDPNGYPIEITYEVRPMNNLDAVDAHETLEAAMVQEDAERAGRAPFKTVDQVWQMKAASRESAVGGNEAVLYVLDVPEFAPLLQSARGRSGLTVTEPSPGYWRVSSPEKLTFERKALGFVPALWNAALTGGFQGNVAVFDRDRLEIVPGSSS
jgi:catechol 2,3-dioxygenase-like lactoylglutathione lyase family enzyme